MPSLMSILSSTEPSKDLIHAMIRTVPPQPTLAHPQAQLVLAALQYWSMHATESFGSSLNELILWFIDQVESEVNELEDDVTTLLSLLILWWPQKNTSGTYMSIQKRALIVCFTQSLAYFAETFKSNKLLLSKAYTLSNLVGHECPKEWNQGIWVYNIILHEKAVCSLKWNRSFTVLEVPRKKKRSILLDSDEDDDA